MEVASAEPLRVRLAYRASHEARPPQASRVGDFVTRGLCTQTTRSGSLGDARVLIAEMWPMRHEYVGVRLMLKSFIKHVRRLRDDERARAEYEYEAAWWADTSYPL